MTIKAGAIYRAKKAQLGMADYSRPFVVLRVSDSDADICFFSTKFELRDDASDVILDASDVEFSASGLRESSYLVTRSSHPVGLEFFEGSKLLGEATGEFKTKIEEWWGAPLQ